MRVFLAGATGVVGRALLPMLIEAGHEVSGMTRAHEQASWLSTVGAEPIICDALDAAALKQAVLRARPDVVVHQLTDLPRRYRQLSKGTQATDRLRTEATRNLVTASIDAGATRIIAQSIAFLYAPDGELVRHEEARAWTDAPAPFNQTVAAALTLERTVTTTPDIEGTVLRYGSLYGPGTWYARDGDLANEVLHRRFPIIGSGNGLISFVHTDDAARAVLRAMHTHHTGIYNIVDDRAVAYHEWLPAYAAMLGARRPRKLAAWLARPIAGAFAVAACTRQQAASNVKARTELQWQPEHPDWRAGFTALLAA